MPEQSYAPPRGAAPTADLTSELGRLADLRSQGLLTDDEFAAAKAKLLG
nr:SHOCT domain-containing protein [Gordonia zhenghanii]